MSHSHLSQRQLPMQQQQHFSETGNGVTEDDLAATHVAAQAAAMATSASAVAAAAAAAASALSNHHSIDLMTPALTHLQWQQQLQRQQQQLLSSSSSQGGSTHSGWLSNPLPQSATSMSDCSLAPLTQHQLLCPQQQADLQQCGLYLLDDVSMPLPLLPPLTQLQAARADTRSPFAAPTVPLSGCYTAPNAPPGCSSMAAVLTAGTASNDLHELSTDAADLTARDADSCGCFGTLDCTGLQLYPSRRSADSMSVQSSVSAVWQRTSLDRDGSSNALIAEQGPGSSMYGRSDSSSSSAGAGPAAAACRPTTAHQAAVSGTSQPVNSLTPTTTFAAPVDYAAAGPVVGGSSRPHSEHLPQVEGFESSRGSLSGSRGLVQSAAPKWAGKYWHPMAEVVKTGQMSNKGTGVFIPGASKSG
jgi:hypothetical protein